MPFKSLHEIDEREVFAGFHGRFVHTDQVTMAFWTVESGAVLPPHSHVHEQIAHVLEGRFELTVGGNTRVLQPGGIVVIPSNALHSGRALTDCRVIDVFAPPRDDYR